MKIRPLVIDDKARAEAARVLAYAEKHPYKQGMPVPGDNPHYVAKFNTYRAVFTFTNSDELIWRHLTISVPGKLYPHPAAAFAIAELFGFTGLDPDAPERPGQDWICGTHQAEHCVVIAQPVQSTIPKEKAH